MSMLTTNEIKPFNKPGIGIGGASNEACAALNIQSTTQGVLIPRMTTTQRNAIAVPSEGLVIYNTSTKQFEVFDGTDWAEPSAVQLAQEVQDRIAADTALQQAIDAEEAARLAADTNLQNQINTEVSNRIGADTALQNDINTKIPLAQKGAANGVATLDGTTKIPIAQLATATPVAIGTANAPGVSTSVPRADHVHAHGDQPGGTLHAAATPATAGFMSSTDKARLDAALGRHGSILIAFTDATSSTTFASAGFRFPWKNDRNTIYSGGTCIFACTINAVNRPLQVRAYDVVNAVQLGVSATITASGFYTFSFNKPTTDTYIELQIRQTIAGSPAPAVELASIEWNTI